MAEGSSSKRPKAEPAGRPTANRNTLEDKNINKMTKGEALKHIDNHNIYSEKIYNHIPIYTYIYHAKGGTT